MVGLIAERWLGFDDLGVDIRFNDIDLISSGTSDLLVATSREISTLFTYDLDAGTSDVSLIDQASFIVPMAPPEGVDLYQIGTTWHAVMHGALGSTGLSMALDQAGTITRGTTSGSATTGELMSASAYISAPTPYLIAACAGDTMLSSYTVSANGTLTTAHAIAADSAAICAISTFERDGQYFALYAGLDSNAVTCLRVTSDGRFEPTASLGAANGLGVNTISDILTVDVAGQTYAVIAASGSSSLSVAAIDAAGHMQIVDHVIDNTLTRFGNVDQIKAITIDGVTFIVAAGNDDGISILTLMPDGTLVHRLAIADTQTRGLTNVSNFELLSDGHILTIIAGSETESGMQSLTFDLGLNGQSRLSQNEGEDLTGTAQNEALIGGEGDDNLNALNGDDFLYDGAGSDTMTGGAGRDVFVLTRDGARDTITDFDVAHDQLDLSAYDGLRNINQLEFATTATGGILTFDDERLDLTTPYGDPIMWLDLVDQITLTLSHYFPAIAAQTITHADGIQAGTLLGTNGNDIFVGGTGDDRFVGYDGSDSFTGGDGYDLVDYSSSSTYVSIDLMEQHLNAGAGEGDTFSGIEGLILTDANDRVSGDTVNNIIYAGGGNDTLYGKTGRDYFYGEDGNDRLNGGKHKDRLYGDEGNDRIHGDWGHDYIKGANGDDLLRGGPGRDRIYGGNDNDILDGGESNDYLSGGKGNDTFIFNDGHDVISDLSTKRDIVQLDVAELDILGLSPHDIVTQLGAWIGQNFVLDFGNENTLTFFDLNNTAALTGVIELI
ncbi:calcium-binding protein [Celeribacter marinus]|uniref:calcium-binding protein n=1 Tax=Celeribacter marinus TaxID=1397108 RepID=UPI00317FF1B2